METVLESDSEEQVRGRETQEEEEEDLKLEAGEPCPGTYRVNSPEEIRLLAIADNFQRQYLYLYPDRKPLLLCPVNEYGVKKFLSTSLRPTPTVHHQLFTWEGCASFVADFLSVDPLEPPVELPRYLFSSTAVLQTQRATCFESATLLCSLLLGADYDAYCVSGYAVKEMCLLDQSLQECPLLDTNIRRVSSEAEQRENKYMWKPPRELKSHFLIQQERKKQDDEAARLQKQKLQEEQESERRPADPLRGLRVHCWVLVLSGSRSVRENFFIDPLTGNSYATDDDNFLGIESVWNNFSYYVNMQDCSNGCADMVYDLEDLKLWEPVLYGATSKKQLILDVMKKKEIKMMSKISNDQEEEQQPRVFEMPRSWVGYIAVSAKDLENPCAEGTKVSRYRKAKLEKFAPYLKSDGLVTRLTAYRDLNCTEVVNVKEWYQHRHDHLEEKEVNKVDNFTTERFRHGRSFHLLFHRFTSQGTDTWREMEFSSGHVSHLVRRVESPGEMTETFDGREDFLFYRHVVFDGFSGSDPDDRPLQEVLERFHRNRSKPANEDVAERVFLLAKRVIKVTYHSDQFIPSNRTFTKPRESTEEQKGEDFTADMVTGFQANPSEKPLGTQTLYKMLVDLIKDEEKVLLQIEASKQEVRDIVARREQEEGSVQFLFSPWTTTGAIRARRQRQEMERLAVEEQRWLREKEKDILAPFLIRLNNAETLSAGDARKLHQDCLSEFKQRLVEEANLIQERYEKATQGLQRKQQWYQKNQLKMTIENETDYQIYCSEKTLQIYVAKKRLSMHKEAALRKYQVLDQKLKRDPRLSPHLLS
ncbi:dynein regulatory complex subunit 7 [Symphorus nematophorus]